MFYDKGEKLAFAHIDVEGVELDVLKGGIKTIKADRPIFTVELIVHENVQYFLTFRKVLNIGMHSIIVLSDVLTRVF